MSGLEIDDLRIVEDIEILMGMDLVIAGAGKNGIYTARVLTGSGMHIVGFCDNNRQLWDTYIGNTGFLCRSFEEMADRYNHRGSIRFLLTSHFDELAEQLGQMGVNAQDMNSYWAALFSVWLNIGHPAFPLDYRVHFRQKYRDWSVMERARYMQIHAMDNYVRSWRRMITENPVFVYQFGKAGSQSVYRGIEACGIPVEQSHALAYEPAFMGDEMRSLYRLFQRSVKCWEKVKIINLVREPVARDLSNLFELWDVPFIQMFAHVDHRLSDSICDLLAHRVVTDRMQLERMSAADIHYQYKLRGLCGDIFQWYEQEMQEVFQIDVLDYPFDRERGMGIIREGNIEVLVLTLEQLEQNRDAVGDFLGIGSFQLCNTNQAECKDYKYLYRNVTRQIRLPDEYLRRYYFDNRFVSHFYTPGMQQEFYRKWKREGGTL